MQAAGQTDAVPLFDGARTRELADALGEDWLDDLRGHLTDGLARLMDDLRAAVGDGDAAAVRRAVHTLKGTAANYGCARLADAAGGLQPAAPCDAAMARVEAAYRETADALTRP